jgi:hypothetical protein
MLHQLVASSSFRVDTKLRTIAASRFQHDRLHILEKVSYERVKVLK